MERKITENRRNSAWSSERQKNTEKKEERKTLKNKRNLVLNGVWRCNAVWTDGERIMEEGEEEREVKGNEDRKKNDEEAEEGEEKDK